MLLFWCLRVNELGESICKIRVYIIMYTQMYKYMYTCTDVHVCIHTLTHTLKYMKALNQCSPYRRKKWDSLKKPERSTCNNEVIIESKLYMFRVTSVWICFQSETVQQLIMKKGGSGLQQSCTALGKNGCEEADGFAVMMSSSATVCLEVLCKMDEKQFLLNAC